MNHVLHYLIFIPTEVLLVNGLAIYCSILIVSFSIRGTEEVCRGLHILQSKCFLSVTPYQAGIMITGTFLWWNFRNLYDFVWCWEIEFSWHTLVFYCPLSSYHISLYGFIPWKVFFCGTVLFRRAVFHWLGFSILVFIFKIYCYFDSLKLYNIVDTFFI